MRISASGLFHVGVHLVPSVSIGARPIKSISNMVSRISFRFQFVGAIITYMVILLDAPK